VERPVTRREALRRAVEAALAARSSNHSSGDADRSLALCYHSVHPSSAIASASPGLFDDHLDWLAAECDVVPLESLAEPAADPPVGTATARRRPRVAITFDDGYADNHAYAFPRLVAHGLPATFFITSGLVAGNELALRQSIAMWGVGPAEIEPLTLAQLHELSDAGMEVGSHSVTHRSLGGLTPTAARWEVTASKRYLEDQLQRPVRVFAYPFGKPRRDVTGQAVAVVRAAGFSTAATILYRGLRADDDHLQLPRFPVTGDSVAMLAAKVGGRLDRLGWWEERTPAWLSRWSSTDRSARHDAG
jgi:peptidoglycan/xylan/chitin deacetylase (PgdA/CDA1 family)